MRKILILLFMVQMVAIQGIATNRVMRETVPDDSLHTGIWKTDTLKEVNIKGSSILQSGDRMKVAITKDLRRGTVSLSKCWESCLILLITLLTVL